MQPNGEEEEASGGKKSETRSERREQVQGDKRRGSGEIECGSTDNSSSLTPTQRHEEGRDRDELGVRDGGGGHGGGEEVRSHQEESRREEERGERDGRRSTSTEATEATEASEARDATDQSQPSEPAQGGGEGKGRGGGGRVGRDQELGRRKVGHVDGDGDGDGGWKEEGGSNHKSSWRSNEEDVGRGSGLRESLSSRTAAPLVTYATARVSVCVSPWRLGAVRQGACFKAQAARCLKARGAITGKREREREREKVRALLERRWARRARERARALLESSWRHRI